MIVLRAVPGPPRRGTVASCPARLVAGALHELLHNPALWTPACPIRSGGASSVRKAETSRAGTDVRAAEPGASQTAGTFSLPRRCRSREAQPSLPA
jgi:hypothetical protein